VSRLGALLLLGALALAADPLAKEIRGYDPTVLDKATAKDAQKEAERRAESRYGKFAREHLPDVLIEVEQARKKELLAARAKLLHDQLETEGAGDHSTAAQTLCELYVALAEATVMIEARRDELHDKYLKMLAGDPAQPGWTYKAGSVAEAKALEADRALLRDWSYQLLELQIRCAQLLEQKQAPDAVRYLEREALGKGKEPLLRAKVAEILSRKPETQVGALLGAASRERDPGVRAAILGAVGALGDRARDSVTAITPYLDDPDERVRVATARTLARLHVPEAVEPLIRRLGQETGRARADMAFALESLTGEKLGAFAESWAQWWLANKATILGEGLPPPGGGKGDLRAMRWKGEGGAYYGIPQISKRILYLIDTSDSMRFELNGETRLHRCVSEVSHAIDQLPKDAMFGVIIYNGEVKAWRDEVAPATPVNKENAKTFLNDLRPTSTTNIYDALRTAFAMAGEGASKKGSRVKVDTIYLLSDGAPTLPDTSPDDPERILAAAKEWNALGRITIHTIGIGKELKFSFLEQLAADHHGEFIQRDW